MGILGTAVGDWIFTAILLLIVVVLARIAWVTVQDERWSAAKKRKQEECEQDLGDKIYDYYKWSSKYENRRDMERRRQERHSRSHTKWQMPEVRYDDVWNESFPAGPFVKSYYLNMDVIDEGFTAIGSRYRILKDNETGVLYYADRSGMTLLLKDYARTRYA